MIRILRSSLNSFAARQQAKHWIGEAQSAGLLRARRRVTPSTFAFAAATRLACSAQFVERNQSDASSPALHRGKDTIAFADDGSVPFEKAEAGGCRVRMQRIERSLLVEDNSGCGGAGVTFTGLYRRKK
jgi:hypothetical protein